MAMDRKAFDAPVAHHEAMEKASKGGYRARLLAFALPGCTSLALVLPLLAPYGASVGYLKRLCVKLLLVVVPTTWLVATIPSVHLAFFRAPRLHPLRARHAGFERC